MLLIDVLLSFINDKTFGILADTLAEGVVAVGINVEHRGGSSLAEAIGINSLDVGSVHQSAKSFEGIDLAGTCLQ